MDTLRKGQQRSFTNTVSAGLKSLGGKGKTFYVLEFKNNTQLHRANSSKEIIVDYIEIGRNPKCQVRFGEDCRTVSGVHCAIMREGENYFIKHLSKTNPTLINGKPIADKWYLSSGDQVELSYGGPILGFMVPANNLTSSIPLTRRLGLFRDQALKPYKRAIAGLAATLLLCIAGFVGYAYWTDQHLKELSATNAANQETISEIRAANDSSSKVIVELQGKMKKLAATTASLQKGTTTTTKTQEGGLPPELNSLYKGVYFIVAKNIEMEINGERKTREGDWTGTGFLLDDGRFITARHVIEPWNFIQKNSEEDEPFFWVNAVASNGGKIKANFSAISPTGAVIHFSSHDFRFDKSGDKQFVHKSSSGDLLLTKASFSDDWASMSAPGSNGLHNGAPLSGSLQPGDKLINLGFPFGMGVDQNGIEPIYGECVVSRAGIHEGVISISGRSFDQGNSGGPVLIKKGNSYSVIGLVSAGLGTQGIIIPISKVR